MKAALITVLFLCACAEPIDIDRASQNIEDVDPEDEYQPGYYEGVYEPWEIDLEDGGDRSGYPTPLEQDLPRLTSPEIIVSLAKPLVVHLFDRETGFSAVYPTGVGVLNSKGVSITPSGHYRVGTPNHLDTWYWAKRRYSPAYFDGLPFLRLSVRNSEGAHTYGLHGPITATLKNDYVSHGCMRMAANDVVDLFWMLYYRQDRSDGLAKAPPVSIVPGQAVDRAGKVLAPGDVAEVWAVGEAIDWQAMGIEPRPAELDPVWEG